MKRNENKIVLTLTSVHGMIYLVAARVAQQNLRSWRNWQTRTVQVRVVAIPWRFESSRPHNSKEASELPLGSAEAFFIISVWMHGE